eukprot:GSMAST32.ASY1.ANO1.2496.1 assembled CDS
MVTDFLNGYNATIIMYGQTGSGKTHTMFGPPVGSLGTHTQRGLVPRICEEVLSCIRIRRERGITTCELSVSYIEIYGRSVTDLLSGGSQVGHSRVSAQRFVLAGHAKHIDSILTDGDLQKRRAATAMNKRSSRAHSLFILTLAMEAPQSSSNENSNSNDTKGNVCIQSQLFLADLGGSEQVKKRFVLGQHMREAIYINTGLLALKHCISALNRGDSFIPYQNDKLTMLLSPALGGNSKACVIVCASMDDSNASETLQALRFGEKCMRVKNDAFQKKSTVSHLVKKIDQEMLQLEETIRKKERWETKEERKIDSLAEEGTHAAVLNKQVGAETERARLEVLIAKRADLMGEQIDMSLPESGFGGKYGGKIDALGGHSATRFAASSTDQGLFIDGKNAGQCMFFFFQF